MPPGTKLRAPAHFVPRYVKAAFVVRTESFVFYFRQSLHFVQRSRLEHGHFFTSQLHSPLIIKSYYIKNRGRQQSDQLRMETESSRSLLKLEHNRLEIALHCPMSLGSNSVEVWGYFLCIFWDLYCKQSYVLNTKCA